MVPVVLSPQMASSPHGPSPAAWAKCAGHSVLVVYSIGRRVDDARRLKPQNHPVLVVRPFKNHLKTMLVRFRYYAKPSSWNLGSKWHGNQLTIKNPFMDSTISLTHKRGSCLLKVSKKKALGWFSDSGWLTIIISNMSHILSNDHWIILWITHNFL